MVQKSVKQKTLSFLQKHLRERLFFILQQHFYSFFTRHNCIKKFFGKKWQITIDINAIKW